VAHPPALAALLRNLSKLPGLGPRGAQRVALALLASPEKLTELHQTLINASHQLGSCTLCGNLAEVTPSGPLICSICRDDRRDPSTLCVVEQIADIWALERSGDYRGMYHVLGGVVSALQGIAPDDLSLALLEQRLRNATPPVQEVILALGASIEGQTTGHLVSQLVQRAAPHAVISSLAKGMPVGSSVDYMDEGTLGLALAHRQRI
jgi:recombination protein RecR